MLGIPKVRERTRMAGKEKEDFDAKFGAKATGENEFGEGKGSGFGIREQIPGLWYGWMRGPKPGVITEGDMGDESPNQRIDE